MPHMPTRDLAGTWSYRAFLNDPDLETPFDKLRCATARLTLTQSGGALRGSLAGEGWGTWIDWSLDLEGRAEAGGFRLQGRNVIQGDEWAYDYAGAFAPTWPHATDARDVITGTVIRSKDRQTVPGARGVHATFVAIKTSKET